MWRGRYGARARAAAPTTRPERVEVTAESPPTVLVVDDVRGVRECLAFLLARAGYQAIEASDGLEALQAARNVCPDAILLDIRMPGMSGFEVLERLQEADPELPVIMITGYDDVETAVRAMRMGAYHYLTKPFRGGEVVAIVERALEHRRLRRRVRDLQERLDGASELTRVLGTSEPIAQLAERVRHIAPTDLPVLLTGEEGTGVEFVARAIHHRSNRASGPFVAVDCSVVAAELAEVELFGREAGDGHNGRRPGQLEFAEGGTLYLASVGDLPLNVQDRLRDFITGRQFQRVGSGQRRVLDARVVASTAVDLRELLAGHLFRRELYLRLAECSLVIPPLRERKDDIVYLAKRILDETNRELGKKVRGPSPEALQVLLDYPWPGNLRELRQAVRRAVLVAREEILPEHLGLRFPQAEAPGPPAGGVILPLRERTRRAVEKVEREAILEALRHTGGNKSAAARILGIDNKTLHVKLKKHNLRGTEELVNANIRRDNRQ